MLGNGSVGGAVCVWVKCTRWAVRDDNRVGCGRIKDVMAGAELVRLMHVKRGYSGRIMPGTFSDTAGSQDLLVACCRH